jgi:cytochrome c-type biogenesis protein CcmH/NrfG
MVLKEPQKARDAYGRALKLKPDDAALRQAYTAASRAAEPDAVQPGR